MQRRTIAAIVATAFALPTHIIATTTTAQATSPLTIATGVVLRDGTALADADVVAVAWPTDAALAAAPNGSLRTMPLGRVRTTATGRFAVEADPAAIPADYIDQGRVDVNLVAADNTGEVRWSFTAERVPATGLSQAAWVLAGESTNVVADVAIEMGSTPHIHEAHDPPSAWVDSEGNQIGTASGQAATGVTKAPRSADVDPSVSVPGCGYITYGQIHYGLSEHYLHVYAWSGAMGKVEQNHGSDHTMGIAFKGSGKATYQRDGTRTRSVSAGGSTGFNVADKQVWNRVNYQDMSVACIGKYRRPHSVHSVLTNFVSSGSPEWPYCTQYNAGIQLYKSKGRNRTYGEAIDIGVLVVSARNSFSEDSKIAWNVTSRTLLCGNEPTGWAESKVAEAHYMRPTTVDE